MYFKLKSLMVMFLWKCRIYLCNIFLICSIHEMFLCLLPEMCYINKSDLTKVNLANCTGRI